MLALTAISLGVSFNKNSYFNLRMRFKFFVGNFDGSVVLMYESQIIFAY